MKIGIFDSGLGGLSILKALLKYFTYFNYLYLGDNRRAPYGCRDRDEIVEFSSQSIECLFDQGCDVVIIACNTASIHHNRIKEKLATRYQSYPLLEIVNPTATRIGMYGKAGIGVLGTAATIQSKEYETKIKSLFPDRFVIGEACPIWVHMVETNEHLSHEAIGFLQRHVDNIILNHDVDTLLLACTHYGLLAQRLKILYPAITIIDQGEVVVSQLSGLNLPIGNFTENGQISFLTSGSLEQFNKIASKFLGMPVRSIKFSPRKQVL